MNETEAQKEFIKRKRGEILAELQEYLTEVGNAMSIEQVLGLVYEESDEDDFDHLIVYLSEGDDAYADSELAQEFAMELFNYFPRKSLGGLSLAEKMAFDELKKMEETFQNFKNGEPTSYSYRLPEK